MNFTYTVDHNAAVPIMLIDRHIGMDKEEGMGIDGAQFARELYALDTMGKKQVMVRINSPGGAVMDGYSMCSAILNTSCAVDTYCDGMAASIAGVIFLCGRIKYMADYSIVMMHDPYGDSNSEALEKIKNSIAALISSRCGKPEEEVKCIMAKETYIDAYEAINMGVCDHIEFSAEANTSKLNTLRNNAREFWKEARLILNKAKVQSKQTTDMDIKNICNRLGLNPSAGEDAILQEIENRAASYRELKNKYDALETRSKESLEKEAADYVKKQVEEGKIKNDAAIISDIVNAYKEKPESVRTIYDNMPTTKKGAKLPQAKYNSKTPTGAVALAADMQEIKDKLHIQ